MGYRLALLGMLCVALTSAHAVEPEVVMTAVPAQVTPGETVTITVTYRWPRSAMPVPADPSPIGWFADLPLTSVSPPKSRDAGEWTERSWTLTMAPDTAGAIDLPQPRLTIGLDGEQWQASAPATRVIVSTESLDLPTARPLLIPERSLLSRNGWLGIAIIGGLIVAGVIAGLIWRRWRQPEPAIPPAEQFAADLAKLAGVSDARSAGVALSAALRRYCGRRWGFIGSGATGREVVSQLTSHVAASPIGALRQIFDQIDGLVWAPADMTSQRVDQLRQDACTWVDDREQEFAAAEASAESAPTPTGTATGAAS